MGLKWAYRRLRNALRKWLIFIFAETTKYNRLKIQQGIVLDSLYIFTEK